MHKTKIMCVAVAACVVSLSVASALVVEFPDLSAGGDFTLNAGDVTYTTNGVSVNVADQATSVVTINGDWIADGTTEVQFGGVNFHAIQDVTLNIGPAGSVTWTKGWVGDGPGGGGTVLFDIATGGQFIKAPGEWLRWHPAGWSNMDASNWEDAWNEGILKRDGVNVGTFAENFDFVDESGGFAMTAIPEPASLVLLGLGALGLIARRRIK